MIFAVALYGGRHAGMLLAHLHSVRATHPDAQIEVYHQDLPAELLEAMQRTRPDVRWVLTRFQLEADKIQRISSKTLAWELAVSGKPPGECLCLLDVDTLVLRPLGRFFGEAEFDVLFTVKRPGFPLNTGVMLCRAGEGANAFFRRWREDTVTILRDPALLRQANDQRLPYGAADQMALHRFLGYREDQREYAVALGERLLRFHAEACEKLNETQSRPLSDEMHIVHYKGGWQPILLDGKRFSKHRTKKNCWEMYTRFLAEFQTALAELNRTCGAQFLPSDFHIVIPSYVHETRPAIRRLRYAIFIVSDCLRSSMDLACRAISLLRREALHFSRAKSIGTSAAND